MLVLDVSLIIIIMYIIVYLYNSLKVETYSIKQNDESKDRKTIQYLKYKTKRLLRKLKKSPHRNKKEVKRLMKNWSGVIKELKVKYKSDSIAYSVNKGERIHICLTDPNTGKMITDKNTMYFVLLHELAHVMTKEYSHNERFWNNFRFLLRFSIKKGMYRYVNYKESSVTFCGKNINHNPCKNKDCD